MLNLLFRFRLFWGCCGLFMCSRKNWILQGHWCCWNFQICGNSVTYGHLFWWQSQCCGCNEWNATADWTIQISWERLAQRWSWLNLGDYFQFGPVFKKMIEVYVKFFTLVGKNDGTDFSVFLKMGPNWKYFLKFSRL